MGAIIYYVSDKIASSAANIVAASGLDNVLDMGKYATRECLSGPDSGRGWLVGSHGANLAYNAEAQQWRRMAGRQVWCGYAKEAPPAPADLQRDTMLPGHPVVLGDGNTWTVPIARAMLLDGAALMGMTCALPTQLDIDESGAWTMGAVAKEYAGLWEIACRVGDALIGAVEEGAVEMTLADEAECAVAALAANYRVGRDECALLGLLNTATIGAVLCALVDVPTLEAALKKKQEAIGR